MESPPKTCLRAPHRQEGETIRAIIKYVDLS